METNEISIHQVRVFLALQKHRDAWMTSKEVAAEAKVAQRTARMVLLRLTNLNLVDCAELFPAHQYRLSDKAEKRNGGYLTRLKRAEEVFGLRGEA